MLGYSQLVETGELIVSELVTNSLAAAPNSPLWVDIRRAGLCVLLEVWDCSPESPVFQPPDFLAEGGRGMHIVNTFSKKIGCDTFAYGKVVWVLLE
jgi:anti-sigma regulatory factor (Ser/Thr protein kinase)